MDNFYEVAAVTKPISCKVLVPGSKSITNRAFLLASMARGRSVLSNVLFSDDSRGMMDCLNALGYDMNINEKEKRVEIIGGPPVKKAAINVRSAGTSARFLTAMLAAFNGEYIIEASEQMKLRPMKPLTDTLLSLGCKVEFLEKDGFLPFKLMGGSLFGGEVTLEAEQSSQFLSALLMTGCLHNNDLIIRPMGRETAKSYIEITIRMMEQFGVSVLKPEQGVYIVKAGQEYNPMEYEIEPDVSNACYFYAAAALTGGQAIVNNVHINSMQGDIKFLNILEKLGCELIETTDGILLKGPENGKFAGIDVDMNDCSDQTMTLAALAPFASSPTIIRNIGHIKHQESNRIKAILTELERLGVKCAETDGGIVIYPSSPKAALVETYEDHRMAMAFSLVGLRTPGIKISNPSCTSKTFEDYFKVFGSIIEGRHEI